MREEESNEFLLKMMESNRERIDYEIDDDLFDKCIFDDDGNLLDIDFDKWGDYMKYYILEVDESRVGYYGSRIDRLFWCNDKEEMMKFKKRYMKDGFEDIDYDDFEVVGNKNDIDMLMNFEDSIVYIFNENIKLKDFIKNNNIKNYNWGGIEEGVWENIF